MRPGPSRDSPVAFVSAADKSNRYRYRISSHGSGVDHLAISSAFCDPAPDAIDQPRSAHIRRCGIQCQIGFDVVAPRLFSIAPLPAPPLLL